MNVYDNPEAFKLGTAMLAIMRWLAGNPSRSLTVMDYGGNLWRAELIDNGLPVARYATTMLEALSKAADAIGGQERRVGQ